MSEIYESIRWVQLGIAIFLLILFAALFLILQPAFSYQPVQCPDLNGNMINYPEGTICGHPEKNIEKDLLD